MIRGVFSVAGAGILLVLLYRFLQGQMTIGDVASRAVVIALCISLVDKVVAPAIEAALRGADAPEKGSDDLDAPEESIA